MARIVIGIFGGSGDTPEANEACRIASDVGGQVSSRKQSSQTPQATDIVLTGGDDPSRKYARNRALKEPDKRANHGWIGVTRDVSRDGKPFADFKGANGAGLVLHTNLGHKRNFLEACLVDGALVLPGEEGTISEAVATLCLNKPVVFIGDTWINKSPLAAALGQIKAGKPVVDGEWKRWIDVASVRLDVQQQIPKLVIDDLITKAVKVQNLRGAENRIKFLPTNLVSRSMMELMDLLPVATTHAFPTGLGAGYEDLKSEYEKFVQ